MTKLLSGKHASLNMSYSELLLKNVTNMTKTFAQVKHKTVELFSIFCTFQKTYEKGLRISCDKLWKVKNAVRWEMENKKKTSKRVLIKMFMFILRVW